MGAIEPSTAIAFGPVPSRRLGQSLGVNNIPPKHCSYSCVYCQVGRTRNTECAPRVFYSTDEIVSTVRERIAELRGSGQSIDYITFVPDGEPTLDVHLADEIRELADLGIPIAVITNGSLLWRPEVREALYQAAWVSVKVDAADQERWSSINQPTPELSHPIVLEGMREFARRFTGTLATETMLVRDINDDAETVERTAKLVDELQPSAAYLAIPTRPPAEGWCHPPTEKALARAFAIFSDQLSNVELLTGFELGQFGITGAVAKDLLGIMLVHPMRESEVRETIEQAGSTWSVIDELMEANAIDRITYDGERFYLVRASAPRRAEVTRVPGGCLRADVGVLDIVDEADYESFPASDPPAWTLGREPGTT